MSDEEKFLSRWSQRKREAAKSDAVVVDPDSLEKEAGASAEVPENEADDAFDPSTWPKLEDVTDTSDITAFFKKGVPESLRNAALRKSWALDPAIRNYVNPALEYAYDWNAPGGVPGTSELAVGTDIVRMVSQIMGSGDSPAEAEISDRPADEEQVPPPNPVPENAATQIAEPEFGRGSVRVSSDRQYADEVSPESLGEPQTIGSPAPQHAVRRHGTATPKV